MAIDYGTKRVGIAVSDPEKIIASPYKTVMSQELFPFLKEYLAEEEVETLVVGKSLNLRGEANPVQSQIEDFLRAFKKRYPEVILVEMDERFTSTIAERAIAQLGLKKEKKQDKALLDKISASILLQDYLQYHS